MVAGMERGSMIGRVVVVEDGARAVGGDEECWCLLIGLNAGLVGFMPVEMP